MVGHMNLAHVFQVRILIPESLYNERRDYER